jgi:phospholipid/cholesterol/gamma-HCH transport system permease protein
MKPSPAESAVLSQPTAQELNLSGFWTARGIGLIERQLETVRLESKTDAVADGTHIEALDTAGAWVLHKLLMRLRGGNVVVTVRGLRPSFAKLLDLVAQQTVAAAANPMPAPIPPATSIERIGRGTEAVLSQTIALLAFIGENAHALAGCVRHPERFRWRTVLYNVRSAGVDALPIVGLLSFMLGIVVAYQGADQLRQYGANIFVADLVGLSMLREFAPLITAIIVAGRSGSAYAAQIGTMQVTEEIDAMRTLGIAPLEQLVLPKIIAQLIALPLLTVFADFLGVLGGMLMARAQLDVGYAEFGDRFLKAVSVTAYMVGIGKAPVFAGIIAVVGCFQGFRTQGGADSVGRQTTLAVVQSIFLVILADGLFSVAFSALDL